MCTRDQLVSGLESRTTKPPSNRAWSSVTVPPLCLSYDWCIPDLGFCVEPGFYKDSDFGIRIENVVIVKEVDTPEQFGDRPYYGFEHVTMVPMDKRLIDPALLDNTERTWVNNYHREVWNKISPRVQKDGL